MRRYLGVISIIIFILTFLVMQLFLVGNVSGVTGTSILIVGFITLSILFAVSPYVILFFILSCQKWLFVFKSVKELSY
jgi:hypothetical protein